MTELHTRHREEWEASQVAAEIIERNVWTIEDPLEVDQILNRNTDKKWKHSTHLVPGWAVAGVYPLTGERIMNGVQFKPDEPPKNPKTGKALKYYSPSKQAISPLFLEMPQYSYWQDVKENVHQAIAICEGAKKAGALLSAEIPAISIPGVATGAKLGRLRPELEAFCTYGRKFLLMFDRDIVEKREVRHALHNLGRLLASKGCVVEVVEWDNRFKGIDDAIAHGVNVSARIAIAKTIEEWKAEAEANAEPNDGETCTLARRYEMVAKRLKGRLRWNALKGKIELDGVTVELMTLRLQLAIAYNIQLPTEDCAQIAMYLAQQQSFSPVAEYLNDCAQQYPADEALLDSLATTYFGTDEPLHRTFLRKTLISAVARALTPGCKVDTVCILQGLQGCGKSTFWKVLASEPWFDDTVTNASDKDERLKLHQSWFVEWAELEAIFKRKDISAVKAFITTQADQVRPPYGRDILEMQRPSIIVGSTNETEFLADPTGNRRYWVIPIVHAQIPLDQLATERDRIWAAAVHAFKGGEKWVLPDEMRQVASADASNYATSDPWEDVIFAYCTEKRKVTVAELLTNVLKLELHQMDKRSEMRVTNLLKGSGWGSGREVVHGRRVRVWKNPKFSHIGCPGCPDKDVSPTEQGGQPGGQPPDQPPGQPPKKSEKSPTADRGLNESGQPDDLARPFPKSTGSQEGQLSSPDESLNTSMDAELIGFGDLVEITTGSLMYKKAYVIEWHSPADGDDTYVLWHPRWAVSQTKTRAEIQLIQKNALTDEQKQEIDQSRVTA